MKSFTKFYVLLLALLVSFGVMAQMTTEEVMFTRALEEQQIRDHGPSIDVPYEPNATRATGDDCVDPELINLSTGFVTWNDLGQTTCGRVDDYDQNFGTCITPAYYANGEDMVYELTLNNDMWLEFTFAPVETYSTFWVMESCPDVGAGNVCLFGKGEYANTPKIFLQEMTAGTYYIQIDSWPSPDCITFDLTIDEAPAPPQADAITTFPYLEGFETCTWPSTMLPFAGVQAGAVVSAQAGYNSSCGAMLDGLTYLNFYHEYNDNCDNAFNNNFPDHTAQIQMNYTPDGTPGALQLDFDFFQSYSFADYYAWFRVRVKDGIGWHVIEEKNSGEFCIRGDIDWTQLIYDLSAYQTTGENYELIIDFVGKYEIDYYNGGDVAMIDNVHLWFVPAGNAEGTAYNGVITNPLAGVEVGFTGDDPPFPPLMTDAAGYYKFSNVATEPEDTYGMYAFLDGMNYIEQMVTYITGVTIEVDWNMASPLMVITPAVLEETMNPNEWRSVPITITNGPTGGPLHWTAEIIFGDPPAVMAAKPTPVEIQEVPLVDGRTLLTEGTSPLWPPLPVDMMGPGNTRDGLDVAIVTSALPASNDFTALIGALLGLGINSVDVIALQPLTTTADDLLAYDGVLFGLNTFFTTPSEPVGDMLADYIDAGGKLIITSPINATGYTNLPVGGRLLTDGYYAVTTGGLNGATVSLGTYNADHPIMEGVSSSGGSLTINCNPSVDAELVASWNTGTAYVATKTVTNPVVHVNVFVAATGYVTGDVPLVIYNAFNWLQASGGGGWLDLSAYKGDVAPGESDFVSALFDATGTIPGQVWTADILFTAQPNISTATVDVSMIIAGEPLVSVDELEVELVNMVTGQVDMSWSFAS